MPEYDLGQIAEIIEEKHYTPGQMIIEEHTEAERFFIISTGKIEISKRFEDGEQFVLAVHSDGEFFGEMALLDEGRRSASARALEETTVLEISRPNFETLLYKAPVLAYSIMKELSSRLRETGALLVSHLQRKNRQLTRKYLDTLSVVMKTLDERETTAFRHTRRVRQLAEALGHKLGLDEGQLFLLEIRALLHEIASSEVPASIAGRDNPLVEDILAVADRFDSLTSAEPAKRLERVEAVDRILGNRKLNRQVAKALEALSGAGELPATD
jgi:CRP/FNR family cyclic AMP-dependent transcriptional regulator